MNTAGLITVYAVTLIAVVCVAIWYRSRTEAIIDSQRTRLSEYSKILLTQEEELAKAQRTKETLTGRVAVLEYRNRTEAPAAYKVWVDKVNRQICIQAEYRHDERICVGAIPYPSKDLDTFNAAMGTAQNITALLRSTRSASRRNKNK